MEHLLHTMEYAKKTPVGIELLIRPCPCYQEAHSHTMTVHCGKATIKALTKCYGDMEEEKPFKTVIAILLFK